MGIGTRMGIMALAGAGGNGFADTTSWELDGTDDYADMGNLDIVGGADGEGPYSVSAWFKTSTTGSVKQKGAFMQSSTHQALFLGV